MVSKISKKLYQMYCIDHEFKSTLILLFYFLECLNLGAICPCGKTEIVHEFLYFHLIECIHKIYGQSNTFEVLQ